MTEHERYLFDLQGYLTVPGALDAEQLRALNTILDERLHTRSYGRAILDSMPPYHREVF